MQKHLAKHIPDVFNFVLFILNFGKQQKSFGIELRNQSQETWEYETFMSHKFASIEINGNMILLTLTIPIPESEIDSLSIVIHDVDSDRNKTTYKKRLKNITYE